LIYKNYPGGIGLANSTSAFLNKLMKTPQSHIIKVQSREYSINEQGHSALKLSPQERRSQMKRSSLAVLVVLALMMGLVSSAVAAKSIYDKVKKKINSYI